MEDLRIVIVGHVDHGKSTLIGRLLHDTGSLSDGKMEEVRQASADLGRDVEYSYVLDHLREEREQGITIDTAQIFFRTARRRYVVIDAPGHVEFVKNMVTGASQAEAALLIVDVTEGVQEQTRRHAYILGLLGLKQVVVLVNKMDAIGFEEGRFRAVADELLGFLRTMGIAPSHVIPVSARHGENLAGRSGAMAWYAGPALLEALDALHNAAPPTDRPMRFPVQDVYLVDGKRIFAGRVESGILRAGDDVTVFPEPRQTRVKSIEVFLRETREAEAEESIGVTTADKLFIERGHVLCSGRPPRVAEAFDAKVFWMGKRPLADGERLTIRLATQETVCTVEVRCRFNSSTLEDLGPGPLQNNEVAQATIRAERPLVVEDFNDIPPLGRFVLVRDHDVTAGGTII
jgi:bifunctional enzyme CysN/CysC